MLPILMRVNTNGIIARFVADIRLGYLGIVRGGYKALHKTTHNVLLCFFCALLAFFKHKLDSVILHLKL